MSTFHIKVGRTRSCFFSKVQKNKLESGLEVLNKVIKHKQFAEKVLQFQWSNTENRRFHRFYHGSGLSNSQVLDRLQDPAYYFQELGFDEKIVILPFNTRKEIQSYSSVGNPIIWISLNCMTNTWYTPVHIASAIGHELALLLGTDSSIQQISKPEYDVFKFPNYLGQLIMQTAELWKHKVSDIRDSFDQLDKDQYNYFPASTVLGEMNTKSIEHHQTRFDQLITSLLIEQENLISLQGNLTPTETARLVCIEEVLLSLNNLKSKLSESSLDGSELDFQFETYGAGSRGAN